jgi:hypothetical protein
MVFALTLLRRWRGADAAAVSGTRVAARQVAAGRGRAGGMAGADAQRRGYGKLAAGAGGGNRDGGRRGNDYGRQRSYARRRLAGCFRTTSGQFCVSALSAAEATPVRRRLITAANATTAAAMMIATPTNAHP